MKCRRRKHRRGIQVTDRDRCILRSLWKWKVLTTAALAHEFFGGERVDAAYLRLRRLASADFIQQVALEGLKKYVWTLGKEGFAFLRHELPELREEGFRSEYPEHDFWCTAFQRGPLLCQEDAAYPMVSEQELRRLFQDHLPDWTPDTSSHRPDGFSYVPGSGQSEILSFEIELSLKSPARYDAVFAYYKARREIYRVLWLVSSEKDARLLQRCAKQHDPAEYLIHLFVTLPDFRRCLWNAKVILGRSALDSVRNLLLPAPSLVSPHGETLAGIRFTQRPYNSTAFQHRKLIDFPDRVAFFPTLQTKTQTERRP